MEDLQNEWMVFRNPKMDDDWGPILGNHQISKLCVFAILFLCVGHVILF